MKRIPMYAFLFLMVMFISLPAGAQSLTWHSDRPIVTNIYNARSPSVGISGSIAVSVWQQSDSSNNRIYASRSTDGGAS